MENDEIIKYCINLDGLINDNEIKFLMNNVMEYQQKILNTINILEIGSFMGKSSCALFGSIDGYYGMSNLYCIDNWSKFGSSKEKCIRNLSKLKMDFNLNGNFLILNGDSYTFVDYFEDNTIDVIFIDGDHNYNSVYNDIKNYYSKLKKGGILLGHDFRKNVSGRVMDAVVHLLGKDFSVMKKGTIFRHIKNKELDNAIFQNQKEI